MHVKHKTYRTIMFHVIVSSALTFYHSNSFCERILLADNYVDRHGSVHGEILSYYTHGNSYTHLALSDEMWALSIFSYRNQTPNWFIQWVSMYMKPNIFIIWTVNVSRIADNIHIDFGTLRDFWLNSKKLFNYCKIVQFFCVRNDLYNSVISLWKINYNFLSLLKWRQCIRSACSVKMRRVHL